jgi:hypothetical protein
MATGVLDAWWAGFKHVLSCEATTRGGMCPSLCVKHGLEVNEAYISHVCSCPNLSLLLLRRGAGGRLKGIRRTWNKRMDLRRLHNGA